jgi:two-component system nitrate/nitrite response regulator NarL
MEITTTQNLIPCLVVSNSNIFNIGTGQIVRRLNSHRYHPKPAAGGLQALDLLQAQAFRFIMLDFTMHSFTALQFLQILQKRNNPIPVIIIFDYNFQQHIAQTESLGAVGFVTKDISTSELKTAISTVLSGTKYYSQEISSALLTQKVAAINPPAQPAPNPFLKINPNFPKIIRHILQGFTSQEISQLLPLGVNTLPGYRQKINEIANSKNHFDLARFALQHSIITQFEFFNGVNDAEAKQKIEKFEKELKEKAQG